jgi:hypothetical protein
MHLFPRNMAPADIYTIATATTAPLYTSEPNWKSLSEPACVPLTTDYFPADNVIERQYMEYVHILALLPDENVYVFFHYQVQPCVTHTTKKDRQTDRQRERERERDNQTVLRDART